MSTVSARLIGPLTCRRRCQPLMIRGGGHRKHVTINLVGPYLQRHRPSNSRIRPSTEQRYHIHRGSVHQSQTGAKRQLSVRPPVAVQQIGNGFVGEVTGVYLGDRSDSTFQLINEALLQHKVLVVRDQHGLTANEQRLFTVNFGELMVVAVTSTSKIAYLTIL
jgi:hypothetical protein